MGRGGGTRRRREQPSTSTCGPQAKTWGLEGVARRVFVMVGTDGRGQGGGGAEASSPTEGPGRSDSEAAFEDPGQPEQRGGGPARAVLISGWPVPNNAGLNEPNPPVDVP